MTPTPAARLRRRPPAEPAPSRTGGSRLPSAPRERRPLLAALAVLLIVGGALLAGFLATRMDNRVQVLAAASTLRPGHVITADDLAATPVSAEIRTLVPASQIDQVIGRTVRVEVTKGQLLDTSQLTTGPVPGQGAQVVGATLEAGRFPASGLGPGDVVDLVDTSIGAVLAQDVQVLDAVPRSDGAKDWSSGAVVSLIVPQARAANLATLGASGNVAVILTARNQPIGDH